MLSQSRYSGDGHAYLQFDVRYTRWEVYGGVRIFGRGVRKKGGSANPPNPPGYGPGCR